MKAIIEPIPVESNGHGLPRSFTWRGRRHPVLELVDGWRYLGRWWRNEPPRDCFLVSSGHLTAELHHEDREGGAWWLMRVSD